MTNIAGEPPKEIHPHSGETWEAFLDRLLEIYEHAQMEPCTDSEYLVLTENYPDPDTPDEEWDDLVEMHSWMVRFK